MYNVKKVTEALLPLVGWESGEDIKLVGLSTTESGRYYQSAHPLLTLQNLKSIAPLDDLRREFEDYDAQADYSAGDKVEHSEKLWEATAAGTGNTPEDGSDFWKEYDPLSAWLKTKTEASIQKAIDNFIETAMTENRAKKIVRELSMFDGPGYTNETTTRKGRTVGFRFKPKEMTGIGIRLDKVGLQFSAAGDLTIKLYHSSQVDPIQQKTLSITKPKSEQWFSLGWELPYQADDYVGGYYTVEYEESAAPGDPGNKFVDYHRYKGNPTRLDFAPPLTPFLGLDIFYTSDRENPAKATYAFDQNFGLNFMATVYCDLSDFIIRQKEQFTSLLINQVGMSLLRELAYNPNSRVNKSELNISRGQVLYEIEGDSQGRPGGLLQSYKQALKAIHLDTAGISRACLPCTKKGVRWR